MKSIVFVVFACLISVVVFGAGPPNNYQNTITLPSSATSFNLITAVGTSSLTTAGTGSSSNPTANSFAGTVSGLGTYPQGVIPTGAFVQGGVIACDLQNTRGLFWKNTVYTGEAASIAFGVQSFTTDTQSAFNSESSILQVGYLKDNVIFADSGSVYLFNITTFNQGNTVYYPPAAHFPQSTIGNCESCTYPQVSYATALATGGNDKIFYGLNNCILVWNLTAAVNQPTTGRNTNEPQYAIGQPTLATCGGTANDCSTSSTTTCFTGARAMAVDCYGGLWLSTTVAGASSTQVIMHFPALSTTADFAFSTANWPQQPNSISFGTGNRCGYMAVSTSGSYSYILQVTYSSSNAPTAVSAVTAFGTSSGSASVGATTNNIGFTKAVAWDVNSPDYLYAADTTNQRVVYFSPFGTSAASQSLVPSQSRTPSITPTATQTPTSSTSRSPTASVTPSITPTMTTTASAGASQSRTSSPTPTLSLGATPSPSPNSDESSSHSGSASICSWYSLLF